LKGGLVRRAGRPRITKVALTIDQASLLDRRRQVVTIDAAAVNQQLQNSHVVTALSRACQRPQHAGTAARVQQEPHDLDVPGPRSQCQRQEILCAARIDINAAACEEVLHCGESSVLTRTAKQRVNRHQRVHV
jgi:hypothetical protein